MKLTEAKLKELILEVFVDDMTTPIGNADQYGKLTWPDLPPVSLRDPKTRSAKQVMDAKIFKKYPVKSFLAGVNRIVDEFSIYYPADENGKKTKRGSFLGFKSDAGRYLEKPGGDASIKIKANKNNYKVQIRYVDSKWRGFQTFKLTDYQTLPEGEEFNVFLGRIRAQIQSYIEANNW